MLVLKYNNNATLGNDVDTATNFNVANFTGTSYISVDDFRNASNTTITIQQLTQNSDMYLGRTSGTRFSAGPTGGAISPFWLLVHPNEKINAQGGYDTIYKYDGCRFQCYPSSGSSGHLMGYRQNTLTYDFQPIYQYVCGGGDVPSDNIPVSRILSVQWVGIFNSELQTCTALRPLYVCTMNGIAGYDGNTVQCFYGPLVPASTVSEWFSELKQQRDDDDPQDDPNPDDDDSQDASAPPGANWSWLNQFSIMNWNDDDPWPSKLLVDVDANSFDSLYWFYNYNDYFAWNDNNDGSNLYHGYEKAGRLQYPYRDKIDALYNHVASMHTWGSNVLGYEKVDGNSGRFTTLSYPLLDTNTYDQFWATTALYGGSVIIDNKMTMEYDNTKSGLNTLTIRDNGSYFNGDANYPNAPFSFSVFLDTTLSAASFPLVCIIRYRSHYYLGGICAFVNTDANNWSHYGFAVICRIDKLKDMPNFGGPDPDDPGGPTGDGPGIDPDDTFGDDSGSNPDTDKRTDDSTGDGTEDPDPDIDDGNDDPDDDPDPDPDPPGTGEKQTNPVNTKKTTNTHDGSVGNGIGDPHHDDDEITDPGTTLPAGGTTGTIGGAGFLSIFTPTQVELTAFSGELFSTSALTAIKQYFSSNPMDGIFGLHMVPFTGFASGVTANPRIGTYDFSTALTLAGDEFINVDYGELYIPFVYDGYENFAPQSDAKIFLPFIGTKDIDINIIQGCKIHLKYNVSLVTGDIYAYLYAQWASRYQDAGIEQGIDHLIYHWQGNCAVTIPISHVDSTNYISGAMQIAGGITSLAAGAVAGSPFTIPSGITGVTQGIAEMGRSSIITSGNISGVAAFMGSREPYLILSRPIIAFNSKYNHYLGRKSNAIMHIRALAEGSYTVMRNVDLSGVTATNDELQQIEGFLKGGFYV